MKRSTFLQSLVYPFFYAVSLTKPVNAAKFVSAFFPLENAKKQTRRSLLHYIPTHLHHEPLLLMGVRPKGINGDPEYRNQFNSVFIVITQKDIFTYPGNTLPSGYGFNPAKAVRKHFPVILPGLYTLKVGTYISTISKKRKKALTQESAIKAIRDNGFVENNAQLGIHIHSSGSTITDSTNSWGCGTIPEPFFGDFYSHFTPGSIIPYLLIESE